MFSKKSSVGKDQVTTATAEQMIVNYPNVYPNVRELNPTQLPAELKLL